MSLLVIILIINCTYLLADNFGYTLTKSHLRGMHKKELEKIMQIWVINAFNVIFDNIITKAKEGINEYEFTIACNNHLQICKTDGLRILTPPINLSYNNTQNYIINLINSLHNTFPDSNFTTNNKYCCGQYTIKW